MSHVNRPMRSSFSFSSSRAGSVHFWYTIRLPQLSHYSPLPYIYWVLTVVLFCLLTSIWLLRQLFDDSGLPKLRMIFWHDFTTYSSRYHYFQMICVGGGYLFSGCSCRSSVRLGKEWYVSNLHYHYLLMLITFGKYSRHSNGWQIRGWWCTTFHCSSNGRGGGWACLIQGYS